MINPSKGCIEIRTVPSAWVDLVANQVQLSRLTRYPQPSKLIVDRGNTFLVEFREMKINDYSKKVSPITSRSSQANTPND